LYERAQIYATDMSLTALEMARQGVYAEAQVSSFSRNYLDSGGKHRFEDYYSSAYERIVVRESLRRNIVFFQHDLASDHALGEMHVVFCRNVLLYFGTELRNRAAGIFGDCLERGGFLCLGKNEGLPPHVAPKFSEFSATERIFRRRPS
jgi:chemotaxis protein methyltransferase CheR